MDKTENQIKIPYDQMKAEFFRILLRLGFATERAYKCAEIFTLNSLEGVYSHGVNRFPRFVKDIKDGLILPGAIPTFTHRTGAIEQWNGNLGPGPLNAVFATDRVMDIASMNGLGLLAMANTNHWMRGGTYGWQAARKGFVLICWTNTCPNMPAWGAKDPRLGNNPLIIAVPYHNEAIVLDFAMSQFSYGRMDNFRKEGKKLPFMGGYNKENKLTDDPAEILESWRPLPAGYWKGSGLSLLLDILATLLSGGNSTHEVRTCVTESAISQVFIAIQLKTLNNFPGIEKSIDGIIEDLKKSVPENDAARIRFPGESVVEIRNENLANGIPVNRETWAKISAL
jgi:3-dehydro-L-gulonate 2-dehydrogenase